MKKYEIKCGNINGFFEGKNPEFAFKKAIRKTRNYHLAPLMKFREMGIPYFKNSWTGIRFKSGEWHYQNPLKILTPNKKI